MKSLSVLLLTLGLLVGCQGEPEPDDANAKAELIVFAVEGMTCESCVNSITKTVAALPTVRQVTVSLDENKATVMATKTDEATKATIAAAINRLGFTATAQ